MSRGIIEAQTLRTEQFEFEARTSDPADAQPGEYWIRVDQTGTNPDVIAELRRQDNSGVTTCPIFASAEESNLGSDVTRGPSVVLDDGSVGFIVMTTGRGAVGSPRAVNSAGTQYVSHNALELSAIPDGAVLQWQMNDSSGPLADAISESPNTEGTLNNAALVDDSVLEGGRGVDLTNGRITGDSADLDWTSDHSIFFTVRKDSSFSSENSAEKLWVWSDSNGRSTTISFADGDIAAITYNGSSRGNKQSIAKPSVPYTVRVGYTWDSNNTDMTLYVDANAASSNSNISSIGARSGYNIGADGDGNGSADFIVDNHIQYDKTLTSSEVQQDFDVQPWS